MNSRSAAVRAYEREHCHRCKRYTPCLVADERASPISELHYCAAADLSTSGMHHSHKCRRLLLTKNLRSIAGALNSSWTNGTLRITGPVADGFWVRALVVIAHVQWGRRAGFRRFSVAYSSPADPYDIRNQVDADLRSDRRPRSPESHPQRDGWTQFFDRIDDVGQSHIHHKEESSEPRLHHMVRSSDGLWQLDCAGSARAWEQYSNYAATWSEAMRQVLTCFATHFHSPVMTLGCVVQRSERIRYISSLPLRARRHFHLQADHYWTSKFEKEQPVLGVHLRGTDKQFAIGVQAYLPLISAFICHAPDAAMYVATDDRTMLSQLLTIARKRWPRTKLEYRHVLRGSRRQNGMVGLNPGYHAHLLNTSGAPQLASDVLLDTLLLSRCNYLLKSRSSVSEFAIYWSPRLRNLSYDFTLQGSPLPSWAESCKRRSFSHAIDYARPWNNYSGHVQDVIGRVRVRR